MKVTRRDFLKTTAAVSAATAIGMAVPDKLLAVAKETEAGWRWDKSVCRFCCLASVRLSVFSGSPVFCDQLAVTGQVVYRP